MKHLKKYNESNKKSEVQNYFLEAQKYNRCSVPDEFPEMASEFYVYDDYYLYDNSLYHFTIKPSGDWYHNEIVLSDYKPSELIKKLEVKLDEIEKAIEKLSYGHDV